MKSPPANLAGHLSPFSWGLLMKHQLTAKRAHTLCVEYWSGDTSVPMAAKLARDLRAFGHLAALLIPELNEFLDCCMQIQLPP